MNFCRDIEFMLKRKTGLYWKFCWAILIPVMLAFIFIYGQYKAKPLESSGYVFGAGANGKKRQIILFNLRRAFGFGFRRYNIPHSFHA